jgi:superfamily I DNA/RNA helicase
MIFDILDMDPYYFDKMGYKHIIIDEFQDTSKNQMEIIKQLLDVAAFESLLVVGDDSQAIYSWRDADSGNIIEFEDRIGQPVKDVNLVENHRSTPEILEFANKVNALNIRRVEKDLVATRPSGKPVTVKAFYKVDKEYEYIVSVVKEKIKEGYAPEDIAILARTKTEIVKIAGKLTDEGIESSLQAPQKMLENSRVQGICSLARAYKDYTATKEILIFQNCLEGGKVLSHTDEEVNEIIDEGQQAILHLRSLYEPKKAEAFRELAKEIAAEDDVAINLAERLGRFVTTDEMVSYIDAFIRFDGEELKREGLYSGVVLSTAHSSKGLEWPVIINSITKYDKKDGMGLDEREENRRLLFVSATRARDELFITGQVRLSGTAETGFAYNEFVREAAEIVGVNISDVREEGKKESDEKREKRIKEVAEKTERKARKKA